MVSIPDHVDYLFHLLLIYCVNEVKAITLNMYWHRVSDIGNGNWIHQPAVISSTIKVNNNKTSKYNTNNYASTNKSNKLWRLPWTWRVKQTVLHVPDSYSYSNFIIILRCFSQQFIHKLHHVIVLCADWDLNWNRQKMCYCKGIWYMITRIWKK